MRTLAAEMSPGWSVSSRHADMHRHGRCCGQIERASSNTFFTVQKALALPLLSDGASVILNASVAHHKGTPMHSVYAATKAAARSFARGWTTDLKDRKIRVNSLSPGLVETPIFGKLGVPAEVIQAALPTLLAAMPMGRVGRVEEAATVALFLASDDSSFVTGIDLPVDGGLGQV